MSELKLTTGWPPRRSKQPSGDVVVVSTKPAKKAVASGKVVPRGAASLSPASEPEPEPEQETPMAESGSGASSPGSPVSPAAVSGMREWHGQ